MRFELDVVCTDNGRHKRTRLTRITIHDDGGGEWRAGGSFHPPDNLEGIEPVRGPARIDGRPNEIFMADCPRCPRTLELTPDLFRGLVVLLEKHGVSRLDISDLPF